jgi:hypothetical protein
MSSTTPNSTPSLPRTTYTSTSRAHPHPNKTLKLSVLYVLSMTLCVLSCFRLVYCLVFGSKLFITPLTFIIAYPPNPLARPLHILPFITRIPTTRLFAFLVVFPIPTPPPLCPTNSRYGLVLAFFLVILLIIRVIDACISLFIASSFLDMLFLTSPPSPLPLPQLPFAAIYEFLDDVPDVG